MGLMKWPLGIFPLFLLYFFFFLKLLNFLERLKFLLLFHDEH